MLKHVVFLSLILLPFFAIAQPEMKIFDYSQLEKYIENIDNEIMVVNFWATWCKPCLKELPYFEALHDKSDPKNLKVLLVSMDFKNQIEQKLLPFINENELKAEVVVLYDNDMNTWINKVDPSWSGSIPATLIINNAERAFYEGEFHSLEEIEEALNSIKTK